MALGDYLEGLGFFVVTAGSVVVAAGILVSRRLGHLRGADRALAYAIAATGLLIGVHLVPGLLGLLSRWTTAGCALVLLGLLWRLVPAAAKRGAEPGEPAAWIDWRALGVRGWWVWGWAGVGVVAVTAWSLSEGVVIGTAVPSTGIDTLTHHLPNLAAWIRSGSFWRVDQYVPLIANGNYPQNGDVVFLSVVQPWKNDFAVRAVNLPFVAVTGLAIYAMARELRAPRASSVAAGAMFAALPVVTANAYDGAMTDYVMTAMLGAGAVFLLRHWRSGLRSDLVLAGLGLGIGFGTKWYAVPAVVVVLAVWAAACVVGRHRLRLVAAQGGALVGLVLLAGGFWLIRNWVVSGNPVEPVRVAVFGQTVFDAPVDVLMKCSGYTILDYLGSPHIWRHFFFPAWREHYALPGLVALLGVLLTLAIVAFDAVRRGLRAVRSADGTAVAVLLCALLLALVYGMTPYSAFGPKDNPLLTGANTRYLIPALMAAVPLSAWAAGRLRYGPEVFALLAAAATVQGLRVSVDVPASKLALGALLLAGVVVLVLVLLATRRLGDRGAAARVAVLAACALGLVAAGQVRQRNFNQLRYETGDPVVAWVSRYAPSGHRVALAGVWGTGVLSPVFPAFGPRLGNEVRYNGVFYKGRLQEYATQPAWAKAIRRGRYDLLIVGRGGYSARHCGGVVIPGSESDDDAWARAEGFRQVVQSQHLTLYRVPPRPG